jgi:hypothetical protein
MKETDKNPLGLENKLYTIEEFGSVVRNKFGGDNYISNIMLAELFLAKYPVYSCKIKKSKNTFHKKVVVVVKS